MDESLRHLLDELPERPPRSKLEPHAEVIRQLRKKRRTYQEIAAFFREHLQLSVAPSTIHEFVKTRARRARSPKRSVLELPEPSGASETTREGAVTPSEKPVFTASESDARERMRAVKNRAPEAKPQAPAFVFNAEEPLSLNPTSKEKK